MSIRTMVIAAVLLGAGMAHAGTPPTSAPLLVAADSDYSCVVVNATSKALKSVVVNVWRADGLLGATVTCAPLNPGMVCELVNGAPEGLYRFCNVTGVGKSAVRGLFCDKTANVCVTVQ